MRNGTFLLITFVCFGLGFYISGQRRQAKKVRTEICPAGSDIDMLAGIIYAECGICDDYEKYLVGSVVINRIHDGRWPSTMDSVLLQSGQFAGRHTQRFKDKKACQRIAQDLLQGVGVVPGIYFFCHGKYCKITPVIRGQHHIFG